MLFFVLPLCETIAVSQWEFQQWIAKEKSHTTEYLYSRMILTFQISFPTVDEEERYSDINVPETRTVNDVSLFSSE